MDATENAFSSVLLESRTNLVSVESQILDLIREIGRLNSIIEDQQDQIEKLQASKNG